VTTISKNIKVDRVIESHHLLSYILPPLVAINRFTVKTIQQILMYVCPCLVV